MSFPQVSIRVTEDCQPNQIGVKSTNSSRAGRFGASPICRTLGVEASAFDRRTSGDLSECKKGGQRLLAKTEEIHAANNFAHGLRKMWKALEVRGESASLGYCALQR